MANSYILPSGTTLCNGKYRIEKELGTGGFGITYIARNLYSGERCAIKEFFLNGYCTRDTYGRTVHVQGLKEGAFEEYRTKFINEGYMLLQFNHPNVVRATDVFVENNTAYIVMKFIEGRTLQQIVDTTGKLSYFDAVNIIAQLGEALDYVHKQGLLHRDVKPSNIMITSDARLVLIDFGSAREFVQDQTQNHTYMLTHGYAPLEQYTPYSRKGAYSDIYSLGCVFYFILTGIRPLEAPARTFNVVAEPKYLVATLPDSANRTIIRAMEMDHKMRHQCIAEFMDDLLNSGANTPKSNEIPHKGKKMKKEPNEAIIHFYRGKNIMGFTVQPKLFMNGQHISKIKRNWKETITVFAPGEYYFSAATQLHNDFYLHAKPGNEYYVKCSMKMGVLMGRVQFTLMDPSQAEWDMFTLKQYT